MRYPPATADDARALRISLLREARPQLPTEHDSRLHGRSGRRFARGGEGAGRRHKKDWATEEAYERFRDAAKALREAIDEVAGRLQFDAAAARPAAEAALQALRPGRGRRPRNTTAKKRELGVMDFNDLLIRARRLLVGRTRRRPAQAAGRPNPAAAGR